jgi:hypothetical protein
MKGRLIMQKDINGKQTDVINPNLSPVDAAKIIKEIEAKKTPKPGSPEGGGTLPPGGPTETAPDKAKTDQLIKSFQTELAQFNTSKDPNTFDRETIANLQAAIAAERKGTVDPGRSVVFDQISDKATEISNNLKAIDLGQASINIYKQLNAARKAVANGTGQTERLTTLLGQAITTYTNEKNHLQTCKPSVNDFIKQNDDQDKDSLIQLLERQITKFKQEIIDPSKARRLAKGKN